MLRNAFDTLARVAPGRIIAGLGAGDDDSIAEDRAFGVLPADPSPTPNGPGHDLAAYRLARFEATVDATAAREYPVWVAGRTPAAIRLATRADGWNLWGGDPAAFARAVERVREELRTTGRTEPFTLTWGGLAVLGENAADAAQKWDRLGGGRADLVRGTAPEVAEHIEAYAAAGAAWVIIGPIDSSNPSNAVILGDALSLIRSANSPR
jgi:alkanesulfonate monooxygenase SsuD/methylene tetrahydromethanopterin reductase-like flavin-dependent oxidoreductase (luciferase family)